jgi:hypothetical protein
VQEQFAEKFPETPVTHRNEYLKFIEKFRETGSVLDADLLKVFANKIKRVQACIDARGHHFQHHLYVHSDFPNADLQKVFANKIKKIQACIDACGHHFQHHL